MNRSTKLVAFGCIGLPLVIGLGWAGIFFFALNGFSFHSNPFDTLAFNRQDWLEDASCVDDGNRRGHMADDIVRHHLVKGMTESQIVILLGPPESRFGHAEVQHDINACQKGYEPVTYFHKSDLRAYQIESYYLGEEQNWAVDTAWLYLYLDPQGHYIGYRIQAL